MLANPVFITPGSFTYVKYTENSFSIDIANDPIYQHTYSHFIMTRALFSSIKRLQLGYSFVFQNSSKEMGSVVLYNYLVC